MRIGIYDPYLNDLGGGEKYMMLLAQSLSDNNIVDVFWDNASDLDDMRKRFGIDFSKINRVKNVFHPHTSLFQRIAATRKYDAVIVLSDGSIPFLGSKKLLLHIQQPLQNMQITSLWSKLKLARVSKFFCNSEYTKSYINKEVISKTVVIYPPVVVMPKNVAKENVILHVGRFRQVDPLTHAGDYKKQHVMVEVFKKMIEKGLKNWKFVLAVSVMEKDMSAFENMKKSAEGFPIEFAINKTNKDLWDLYSKAKIYWHASGYGEDLSKHPEFAEHFGISTVEAMGAGCVPVVINAGGQREIVTEDKNGLLWDSLEELQEKTLTLMKNNTKLKNLAANAKLRAADFSYEKFAENVHALLK